MIKFLSPKMLDRSKKPEPVVEKKSKKKAQDSEFIPRKKKSLGQHFLRKQSVVDHMVHKVEITDTTSVMEIGCGDGFLTSTILLQSVCARLWCFGKSNHCHFVG